MYYLPIAFFIVSGISLLITYLSITIKKTAMEIVNNMGIGYNLANTFDCFDDTNSGKIKNPIDQITLWGNSFPTKKMISNIKKNGFNTIRLPVTWMHFIDNSDNIKPEWMSSVKKVVNLIIKQKIYCILNIHGDSKAGFWLYNGMKSKDKYVNLWTQIANEFKNYNEYLIFESMSDIEYPSDPNYMEILNLNQIFIDTIRNSGGKNGDRLLLIAGVNKDIIRTYSSEYKMPIDPSNKFAISLHYYDPNQFTKEPDDNPWSWKDDKGVTNIIIPLTHWGHEIDYKDMFTNFESIKKVFLDKEIPVVIVEISVITEQKKEKESIRSFLYFAFSMSVSYNGIMSCLYDTSNKGLMNYYNRENDKWYDEKIGENFKKISKGNFPKPTDYFFFSNSDTMLTTFEGTLKMKFGTKKALKVIFNCAITIDDRGSVGFGVSSFDKNGVWTGEGYSGIIGERKFDGTYTFTIDISNKDYHNEITIAKWWGNDFIIFKYLTIEFEEKYTFFNFDSYFKVIS